MRILIGLPTLGAALAYAGPVLAQPGETLLRSLDWNWDPWILLSLPAAALWYAAGAVRLRRRLDAAGPIGPSEVAAYGAGLVVLFLALISPLDGIADQLFWVHMAQHLLLLMVAAPLLVYGRPAIAFLWALGPASRKRVGQGGPGSACTAGSRA